LEKDINLWYKFKSGDKEALSEIYLHHFNAMFQYGIRFYNNPEFIKDVIHDVFINLYNAKERLSSTDNIRFYLLKSLKNLLLKEITKSKKIDYLGDNTLAFDAKFMFEETHGEDEVDVDETTKRLLDALKTLSQRQREIIFLRYESGLEYDEICAIMNLKNDSARKLLFRTISKLRSLLDSKALILVLLSHSLMRV
jgi:RNA polymerase sigma factor (sigma-70 family)